MSKKLENGSKYNEYDLDGDGIVTDEELENAKRCGDTFIRMIELPKELQDKYINYKRKI